MPLPPPLPPLPPKPPRPPEIPVRRRVQETEHGIGFSRTEAHFLLLLEFSSAIVVRRQQPRDPVGREASTKKNRHFKNLYSPTVISPTYRTNTKQIGFLLLNTHNHGHRVRFSFFYLTHPNIHHETTENPFKISPKPKLSPTGMRRSISSSFFFLG